MSKANGNLQVVVKGNKLTLTLDMSESLGRSNSGKTILDASTRGPLQIPGTPVKVILTAFRAPLRDRLQGREPKTKTRAKRKPRDPWGGKKTGPQLVSSCS